MRIFSPLREGWAFAPYTVFVMRRQGKDAGGESEGKTAPGSTLRGVGHTPSVAILGLSANVLVTPLSARPGFEPFWATTDDLHHKGIFVRASRLLPVGMQALLELHFHLPRLQLVLEAEVVHRVAGVGLGMAFVDPPRSTRQALSRLIGFGRGAPFALRRRMA